MKRKGLHPCCTHSAAGRLLPAEPAVARASRNVTEGESEEGVVLWGQGGSPAVTGDPEQGAEAAWRSRGPRASSICSLHCLLSREPRPGHRAPGRSSLRDASAHLSGPELDF